MAIREHENTQQQYTRTHTPVTNTWYWILSQQIHTRYMVGTGFYRLYPDGLHLEIRHNNLKTKNLHCLLSQNLYLSGIEESERTLVVLGVDG